MTVQVTDISWPLMAVSGASIAVTVRSGRSNSTGRTPSGLLGSKATTGTVVADTCVLLSSPSAPSVTTLPRSVRTMTK